MPSDMSINSAETFFSSNFIFFISCRKEREANARLGRPRSSKLLASAEGASDEEHDPYELDQCQSKPTELSHSVKELCKTIDAFIYVVDSSADSERGMTFFHQQSFKLKVG